LLAVLPTPPQHRMIVCYDRYNRFQQIPFGDFSREALTANDWLQVWSEDLDTHRRKLPGSPADHQRRKLIFVIPMKKNRTSCVVIGGHPAGLMQIMQSVFRLRRMIVCCDLYDQFLQIPFGAGVEYLFYLFMLLRLLFMLLKFSCFIAS
jgi:hypothetical protein